MTYATALDVQQIATDGWDELAQRAAHSPLVDGALLAATVAASDRSAWSAEAQAQADAALLRINAELARATSHADTYLFPRYRQLMPLPPELVAASPLPVVVATIAYKRLYGALLPDDVRKGCQWADDWLRDVSKGLVSLGAQDATVAQPAGHMLSQTPDKAFDWAAY